MHRYRCAQNAIPAEAGIIYANTGGWLWKVPTVIRRIVMADKHHAQFIFDWNKSCQTVSSIGLEYVLLCSGYSRSGICSLDMGNVDFPAETVCDVLRAQQNNSVIDYAAHIDVIPKCYCQACLTRTLFLQPITNYRLILPIRDTQKTTTLGTA